MKKTAVARKSNCINCGKRLSEKMTSGMIRWKPSRIDDKGIYCETCGAALNVLNGKKAKKS